MGILTASLCIAEGDVIVGHGTKVREVQTGATKVHAATDR
jgi:hypothetical protein